jgi:hypothetical protein
MAALSQASQGKLDHWRLLARLASAVPVLVWLIAIAILGAMLLRFESRPGVSLGPAPIWPRVSRISKTHRPTLVLFAHPKCPCTRATLSELDRILARAGGRIDGHVIFVKPHGVAQGWEHSEMWAAAEAIPGVTVELDENGSEAKRFGARTSGHVLLYGADERLVFSGGITGSRGHAGDNAGADSINSYSASGKSTQMLTPVFGCSLLNDADLSEE